MNTINELHLYEVRYELLRKPAKDKTPVWEVFVAKIVAEHPEECERHLFWKFGEKNGHIIELYKSHEVHAIAVDVIGKIVKSNYEIENKRRHSAKTFEEENVKNGKEYNSRFGW